MGNVWISKVHFIKQLWLCSVLMAQVVYLFSPRLNSFVMHGNAKEGSWLASPNLPSSYLLRDSDYIGIFYCFSILSVLSFFSSANSGKLNCVYLLKIVQRLNAHYESLIYHMYINLETKMNRMLQTRCFGWHDSTKIIEGHHQNFGWIVNTCTAFAVNWNVTNNILTSGRAYWIRIRPSDTKCVSEHMYSHIAKMV